MAAPRNMCYESAAEYLSLSLEILSALRFPVRSSSSMVLSHPHRTESTLLKWGSDHHLAAFESCHCSMTYTAKSASLYLASDMSTDHMLCSHLVPAPSRASPQQSCKELNHMDHSLCPFQLTFGSNNTITEL